MRNAKKKKIKPHPKKSFKVRMKALHQSREKLAEQSSVTILSTLNQHYQELEKVVSEHTRHPRGTKGAGLRKGKAGKGLIALSRNRFGVAEEQSSRLRRLRRAGNHAARLKFKKELQTTIHNLEED